jgi:8-hydroxy-5-deazaflavin:NADPH oxidoreductase
MGTTLRRCAPEVNFEVYSRDGGAIHMRIGILGAGSVGGTLGRRWAKEKGHEVRFGVPRPDEPKYRELAAKAGKTAKATTVEEAAAFGEVVVLATPWEAAKDALKTAGAGALAGKPLLDCTNPLKEDLSGLAVGFDESAAENVQRWAPEARVVKIFNTTGANNMEDPRYGGSGVTMLHCGDDKAAKETAAALARDLGFEPLDAGALTQARLLEPLAMLWISLAYGGGLGREIAFRLVKR